MRFGRFWRQARLRNLVLLLAGAILVPAVLWAVPEIITRDTTQVPCSAIDDVSAECRNLRYHQSNLGLDVNITGTTAGGATPSLPVNLTGTSNTVNQGAGAAALSSPWSVVVVPATAGTGVWQNSNLPAVHTAATFTVAGVAAQSVYVTTLCAGYYRSGGAMTAGGVILSMADGTNTFRIPIQVNATETSTGSGQKCSNFVPPIRFAAGATVTFTLPDGGVNAQGVITAAGFQM